MLFGEELACDLGADPRPHLSRDRSAAALGICGSPGLSNTARNLDPQRADVAGVHGVRLAQPPRTLTFPCVSAATLGDPGVVLGLEMLRQRVQPEPEQVVHLLGGHRIPGL
jgi:hypothetical protein